MDTNTILAWVLGLAGVGDIALAWLMADKLPAQARTFMTIGGVGLLVAAALFATRLISI